MICCTPSQSSRAPANLTRCWAIRTSRGFTTTSITLCHALSSACLVHLPILHLQAQFVELLKRDYTQYWRIVPYNGTRFAFSGVIAAIMGCILWNIGDRRSVPALSSTEAYRVKAVYRIQCTAQRTMLQAACSSGYQ